jgi:hypothetical protein
VRSRNAGLARPELAFSDAGCDTADVLRRWEGAIERTFGVAASPALGTLRNFGIMVRDQFWQLSLTRVPT